MADEFLKFFDKRTVKETLRPVLQYPPHCNSTMLKAINKVDSRGFSYDSSLR
jgi:hypothetical protein